MKNKKLRNSLILCLLLTICASAALNVQARETLFVQIEPPARTSIVIGDQLQLAATASGGPAGYNYQWYQNDAAIAGATAATYIFNATQTGSFNIKCVASDATGLITEAATSQVITLTVTPRAVTPSDVPLAGNPLGAGDTDETAESNDQGLLTIGIAAAAIATTVIIVATVVLVRQKKPSQTTNP